MTPIVVRASSAFQPPPEGTYIGTVQDIDDLGVKDTGYGPKDRMLLKWAILANGKPVTLHQQVTKTLHRKGTLVKIVKALLGGLPAGDLDVTVLKGRKARLVVEHNQGRDGLTYANVTTVLPSNGNVHGIEITDDDLPPKDEGNDR